MQKQYRKNIPAKSNPFRLTPARTRSRPPGWTADIAGFPAKANQLSGRLRPITNLVWGLALPPHPDWENITTDAPSRYNAPIVSSEGKKFDDLDGLSEPAKVLHSIILGNWPVGHFVRFDSRAAGYEDLYARWQSATGRKFGEIDQYILELREFFGEDLRRREELPPAQKPKQLEPSRKPKKVRQSKKTKQPESGRKSKRPRASKPEQMKLFD